MVCLLPKMRVRCVWLDHLAGYVYLLDRLYCERSFWGRYIETWRAVCCTSEREKAVRWAAHYEVALPEEPAT